ncbi:MAG TPA: N-acetylmuramoyl-L-alanine amidase [Acidimicrobiia bacterium]|nr:N-acetylmuramoyl-L-alanine amidase [Acidimicrobiia bacterium]
MTTTRPAGPPVALVAPSGVPVAVTAVNESSFEVLTPCGNTQTLSDGTPIYEVDVVVDPGHGGPIDTGALGPTGLAEKEINLRVALEVLERLTDRGIATVSTRNGDYPIPIRTRSEYARLMGAAALVSIHHNSPQAPPSDIPGTEIFVQQESTESQRLGGLLYDTTMAALGQFQIDWQRSSDAGVMTVINPEGEDAYGMVRIPEMPSALIELGYIANRAEAEFFRRPQYVEAAAGAVADAVERFLTTKDTGASLVEGRIFDPTPGVGADKCIEPSLELSLYPDVVAAEVARGSDTYSVEVTISSPYDTTQRYADAFRVVGDDGRVYGIRQLTHDHANEQPFTRSLGGVEIPGSVDSVTVEARDQVYGWGGETVTVELR